MHAVPGRDVQGVAKEAGSNVTRVGETQRDRCDLFSYSSFQLRLRASNREGGSHL